MTNEISQEMEISHIHPFVQTLPPRLLAEHGTLISKNIQSMQLILHLADATGMEVPVAKTCSCSWWRA